PGHDEAVYMDRSSVHQDGTLKKVWVLRNYSTVRTLGDSAFPHKSKLILYAFRCEQGEVGYAQWSFQSGELGSGRTVWAHHANGVTFMEAGLDPALNRLLADVCRS
ncbi:MAG: surface-adhesin E family protein, partial [Burkholderiales bacterium]